MHILGIETSCDECAIAVVSGGDTILSNIILSQEKIHGPYRGIVPELASRAHVTYIDHVYREALKGADLSIDDIDGIAVTTRPGLTGSLTVGLSFAKGLAYRAHKPLVGIDHILAHLYACRMERQCEYPYLGLLASGGHTLLALVHDWGRIEVIGTTRDDACGEAFDKVARYFEWGYPGGAVIDRLAAEGDPRAARFPVALPKSERGQYDFSYSGLKTAVIHQRDRFWNKEYEQRDVHIAAAFQAAAIEALVTRVREAVTQFNLKRIGIGGGVAANSLLRRRLEEIAHQHDLTVLIPPAELCTDNGAMIAGLGYHYLVNGESSPLDEKVCSYVAEYRGR